MRNRNKNTFERSSTMISKPPVHLAQYAKTLNLKSHLIYLSCYLGERASHGVLLQLLFLTSLHLLHLVHAPPPVCSYVVLHWSSCCPFAVSLLLFIVTHDRLPPRWQVSHQSSWRPFCGYLLFLFLSPCFSFWPRLLLFLPFLDVEYGGLLVGFPHVPFICSSPVMLPAAVDILFERRLPMLCTTAVLFTLHYGWSRCYIWASFSDCGGQLSCLLPW